MPNFDLSNKTILITGASSGIGRGIAIACAKAGAKCILVARNEERLAQVAAECGSEAIIEKVDVSNVAELSSLVERVPMLDGLVQCAGINDDQIPLKFINEEKLDRVLNTNLKAPILLLAGLEKKKKLNKGASVVLMSSQASVRPSPAHSMYAASKGGLTAFMRAVAVDLSGKKIRVNTIAPAMVRTPMTSLSAVTKEQLDADESRYLLKRYGEPEDIAGAAIYLLSDASSWVTGQQFLLDGGVSLAK